MTKLRVLDLFSGIGGFSLGLERTGGFQTVAFCEIEDYPRRVLAKHWPDVPCYGDIRELSASVLERDGIAVDVICGGFPCQDISLAGKGAGLAGERSGLWRDYARLIGELRPSYVIVENVAALLSRGLRDVLGDLAALGFDAEWHCIPASAVGAPHRRDRLWIVAYSGSEQHKSNCAQIGREIAAQLYDSDAASERRRKAWKLRCIEPEERIAGMGKDMADYESTRLSDRGQAGKQEIKSKAGRGMAQSEFERRCITWWSIEPDVGRVANGVPSRVDRIKGLGNAVVPQIPEMIGNAILASLEQAA